MYQQTHTVQDRDNKTMNKANHSLAQAFVVILQVIWGILRKIAASVLFVFHMFVQSAEPQRPANNDYWWNSSEIVEDLMKH